VSAQHCSSTHGRSEQRKPRLAACSWEGLANRGGWLVGGSTRSIASAAYRDQSQNPLTACVPSRTCGPPNGAPRLSLAEGRCKLFLPRVRALLPSSLSRWSCEGYAEIGGGGVTASQSLGC